jgi:hypothetical protein
LPFVWENRDKWGDLRDDANREKLATQIARRKWTRAGRFGLPPKELWQRLADAPPTLGSVLGTCFLTFAETTGKSRWGDKRPMYSRYLDAVFSLFPDAQFVNVVRDPRGAVASIRKVGWYEGDIGPAVELWERSVASVDPWRKHLAADQLIDVRYEDLVAAPDIELMRITDCLGLEPAVEQMLHYYEELDEVSQRFHAKLAQPVSASSVDSWTKELSDDEVALVEQVTAPYMERFGYARKATGVDVPTAVSATYEAQRAKREKERDLLYKRERSLRWRYRYPVAARLTTGQLARHRRMRRPPLRQRVMGRPQ